MRGLLIAVVLFVMSTLSVYAHLKPEPEPVRGGTIPEISITRLYLPYVSNMK